MLGTDQMSLVVLIGEIAGKDFDRILDYEVINSYRENAYEFVVRGVLRSGARGIYFDVPTEGKVKLWLDQMSVEQRLQQIMRSRS